MAKPLSLKRRRTIAVCASASALAASANVLHHTDASGMRWTIVGTLAGLVTGGIVILFKRKQMSSCR